MTVGARPSGMVAAEGDAEPDPMAATPSVRVERPVNLCGLAYAARIFVNVKLI